MRDRGSGANFRGCSTSLIRAGRTAKSTIYATWTGISGDVYYRNGAGRRHHPVTNEWLEKNIRAKGPLGKGYPRFMFIMEGDTPRFSG